MGVQVATPLCPAGHLPLKGGDWQAAKPRQTQTLKTGKCRPSQPISPLEGEMPGRAEGGKLNPLRPEAQA